MLALRKIGQTAQITAGANAQVTVNGATLVLVSNLNATTWGYFRACDNNTETAGTTDFPIAPNSQVPVVVSNSTAYWAANGANLDVTPVEVLRSA